MRSIHLIFGLAIVGLTLASTASQSHAQEKRWRGQAAKQAPSTRSTRRSARVGAFRREYDRTPGHYVYRDHYPNWAARAFQPSQSR